MNSHTALIMLIVVMALTAGAVLVMQEINQNIDTKARAISTANEQENSQQIGNDVVLVNSIGTNVSNGTYKYTQFQMRYDGTERLSLNDTHIQISTDNGVADLDYRNGTTERDEINGFYTK